MNISKIINETQFAVDPLQTIATYMAFITELPREQAKPFVERAGVLLETLGGGFNTSVDECLDAVYAKCQPDPTVFKDGRQVLEFLDSGRIIAKQMDPVNQYKMFKLTVDIVCAGSPSVAESMSKFYADPRVKMMMSIGDLLEKLG